MISECVLILIYIYMMHCRHYYYYLVVGVVIHWESLQAISWVELEVSIRWLSRQATSITSRATVLGWLGVEMCGCWGPTLLTWPEKNVLDSQKKPYSFLLVICYSFTYDKVVTWVSMLTWSHLLFINFSSLWNFISLATVVYLTLTLTQCWIEDIKVDITHLLSNFKKKAFKFHQNEWSLYTLFMYTHMHTHIYRYFCQAMKKSLSYRIC